MGTVKGTGTSDNPWKLETPPGTSAYEAYRDAAADPPALVVQIGKTQLRYQLRCIDDLHAMLREEVPRLRDQPDPRRPRSDALGN